MKKYVILFYITERNIEGIEELFHFVPWKLGEDFFIYKRKSPSRYENVLTVGNVSVVVLERDCKIDYLPFHVKPDICSVGNGPGHQNYWVSNRESVCDLCGQCVKKTRRAVCLKCLGTGNIKVRDDDASFAQATYGENRTEYKTVGCDWCKEN